MKLLFVCAAFICFESYSFEPPPQPPAQARAGAQKAHFPSFQDNLSLDNCDRCEGCCANVLKAGCLATLLVLAHDNLNSFKSVNGATLNLDSHQKQGLWVAAGVGYITFNRISSELRQRRKRRIAEIFGEGKKNK